MTADTGYRYILATGDEGEHRLELVHSVHGPDTEKLLERAGIRPGLRAADIGSGIGVVSCWMARNVAPGGEVVGVDISEEQVRVAARRAAQMKIDNVTFVTATSDATGLERASFDLVYARFLLMHLPNPEATLNEMAALLRPGGTLVVEDGDFEGPYCSPRSSAYERCFELYRAGVRLSGADPLIGLRLTNMVLNAGFSRCDVSIAQPVLREGEAKRLPEWTLVEARDKLIEAGLTTDEEITAIAVQLRRLAADTTTRFGMAVMTQVRAVKAA